MENNSLRIVGRFIFLALFQILILNNIQLAGYLNPYLYILFILSLPASTSRMNLLLWAVAMGLVIDISQNSGGVHMSATLTLAYIRPFLIRFVVPATLKDSNSLSLWAIGGGKFFTYAALGVLIHHLWLFSLEAFRISEALSILSRTFVSAPVTLVMIYITQLFVYREEV